MNKEQIIKVINNESLPDSCHNADYLETQNSWVIRSDHYAFKIRKPQQATGAELTDVESRKEICNKELALNKLLGGRFYEDVIPIQKIIGKNTDDTNHIEVVDYALQMKRLDDTRKLSERLKTGNINESLIKDIARMLLRFHHKTKIIKDTFNITRFQNEFEEIKRCTEFVEELLGNQYEKMIYDSIVISKAFLANYRNLIHERTISGFVRDGHGDLSSDKIYLYNKPIIVDRVVIDDEQRKTDVLYDVARLGVDLDYYGLYFYDELLLSVYLNWSDKRRSNTDRQIYTYYKLYRTNLLITQLIDATTFHLVKSEEKNNLISYFNLYFSYMQELRLTPGMQP